MKVSQRDDLLVTDMKASSWPYALPHNTSQCFGRFGDPTPQSPSAATTIAEEVMYGTLCSGPLVLLSGLDRR